MKNKRHLWISSLIVLVASFATAWAAEGGHPFVGSVVVLAPASGAPHVEVKSAQGSEAATPDKSIRAEDHVVTGPGSGVSIELNDGSVILLGPDSDFWVSELETSAHNATRLRLDHGVAHFMVSRIYGTEKTFALLTGDAALTVKGTEFVVDRAPKGVISSCHTLDGSVVLAGDEPSLADKSKNATLKAGEAGQMKQGAGHPSAVAKFSVQQYLEKLDEQYPMLKELRSKSMSKFASSTHPAESRDEEKPRSNSGGKKSRRRGGRTMGF